MKHSIVPILILTSSIAGCGGGGGSSSGGNTSGGNSDTLAQLSQQNAIFAANSLETLEQPVALSNVVISVLHQLNLEDGTTTAECLFDSNGTGTYTATLNNQTLSITFNSCNVEGLGDITGQTTATFSSLQKNNHYLEFEGDISTVDLKHTADGNPYTASYGAHIQQTITSENNVEYRMSLTGDESISINGAHLYFKDNEIVRSLNYNQGTYSMTAKANLSQPDQFDGDIWLRTTLPLSGYIRSYPTAGHYEIQGANGDKVVVSPNYSNIAEIDINIQGVRDIQNVSWTDMMLGSAISFPARQGIKSGDIFDNFSKRWYFNEQSPKIKHTNSNPLQPSQTILVMPAPAPQDLKNIELRKSSLGELLQDDMYTISADGPWVTINFTKDLEVDNSYNVMLFDESYNHYASFDFDTTLAFNIEVTQDQLLTEMSPFTLGITQVSDASAPIAIEWSHVSGGMHFIPVKKLSATTASIDPQDMEPGEIYVFLAKITDPYNRKTESRVNLTVKDPINGNSYLSIETDSTYPKLANQNVTIVQDSTSAITATSLKVENAFNSNDDNDFLLDVSGLYNNYVNTNIGNKIDLKTNNLDWAYYCNTKTMQLEVLENEQVEEQKETYVDYYQKVALDFTINCDSGTLKGKYRHRSTIE